MRKSPSKTAQVLLAAAEAIETYGHVKGDLGNASYGFCVVGALCFVAEDSKYLDAYSAFTAHIQSISEFSLVSTWNNAPERTKQEVVSELRKLALEL